MQSKISLSKKYIASPLNYTGGKHKLLPQILPLFPKKIETFVDLFCGGCNVGVNVNAERIICNDNNEKLIGFFNYLKSTDYKTFSSQLNKVIEEFHLSNTAENGYSFYGCNSSDGLSSYNREHFLALRENFNSLQAEDSYYFAKLYILIVYAFNNQIRFNSKGFYNLPVGKRDFNKRMAKKLGIFMNSIANIEFTSEDFREFKIENLNEKDFVYADPPYLITCASYNELDGWNENSEMDLLKMLDNLNKRKIRFALSNVLSAKGKTNNILASWLNKNPEYKCHHLNFDYRNSNYHKTDKINKADEVLITNY